MWHYFKSRQLPNLETPQQIFNKVSELDIKFETEREFVEKVIRPAPTIQPPPSASSLLDPHHH